MITSIEARDLIAKVFEKQMTTNPAGIRLRGSLDAEQHAWLTEVVRDVANNLAMVLSAGDGACNVCEAHFGEGSCPTCGAGG